MSPYLPSLSLPSSLCFQRPARPIAAPVSLLTALLGAFCLVALVADPAGAQLGELEVWFDGPNAVQSTGTVTVPDIDLDGAMNTVITWQVSENSNDIYVRRFAPDGQALEDPIAVIPASDPSFDLANRQVDPKVAASPDGDFVVVWVERIATDPSTVYSIRSLHFDATGTPANLVRAVEVADPSFPGGAHRPDIAALADGGFVVVWRSDPVPGGGDQSSTSIMGRLLNDLGQPTGSQFMVNLTTSGGQDYPTVDSLPINDPDGNFDGGFVVSWTRPDLHMRRFRANGVAEGTEHTIDGSNDGDRLVIAASEDSQLVAATWYRSSMVWARLFDSNLSPIGSTVEVSAVGDTDADDPVITDIGVSGFAIVWATSTGVGDDDSQTSVQARILSRDGSFEGGQSQVNTWTSNHQRSPTVGSSHGELAIAWRSSGRTPEDSVDDNILGYQLTYCTLFCDDWEAADLSIWSSIAAP